MDFLKFIFSMRILVYALFFINTYVMYVQIYDISNSMHSYIEWIAGFTMNVLGYFMLGNILSRGRVARRPDYKLSTRKLIIKKTLVVLVNMIFVGLNYLTGLIVGINFCNVLVLFCGVTEMAHNTFLFLLYVTWLLIVGILAGPVTVFTKDYKPHP